MSADFAADAIFERGDDLAAGGVVLGVSAEDDGYIEREADGVALNLDVAFLHDVEERDLDFSGEVGEFVDGEDAAIGAGQQAVVHGQFAAEVLVGAGGFDGVDVSDEVGYGDVGGGKFFYVALVRSEPCDGSLIGELCELIAAKLRDGGVGIVVDLGAGDVGEMRIEERGEGAEDARFRLSAKTEKDEVVFAEDGVDDLRDDGVFVADDAGEERGLIVGAAGAVGADAPEFGDKVLAELVFDASGEAGGSVVADAEGTESCRERGRHGSSIDVRRRGRIRGYVADLGLGSFVSGHFAVGERVVPRLMVAFAVDNTAALGSGSRRQSGRCS